MKNYVEANVSHKSHTTIKYAMKMLSSSSETIIFMFLGVATVSDVHDWNTWFVVLTIFFCSVYRALGVIILTAVVNEFRLYKLNKVEKFVMSYGGLRGAVAFALVLLINPRHVKLQPMFVTTTIAVIYFTVFFQGITIKPIVKILNVKRSAKRKPTMNERIHEKFMDHMVTGIEDILGHHGTNHLRDKFKRFDNHYIRPYVLRNAQGQEPKILETYSKLAMRDAIDYMRRNASTIGNISGTESMSAIFRNYTAGNLNGSFKEGPRDAQRSASMSYSQLDSSTWNIDLQELEYNPSRKDLTDAKIHHLLAEELVQPYRRHRRLSYSRHAVDDRDLSTQVNYRMHMNIRRLVGQGRHHHKRSKRLKDGKNHVSFPGIQNGSAKQFADDYLDEVLQEAENEEREANKKSKDDWESGITFTAHPSPVDEEDEEDAGSHTSLLGGSHSQLPLGSSGRRARLVMSSRPQSGEYIDEPTVAETSLPWRRRDALHAKMKKQATRPTIGWWCWRPNDGPVGSPQKKMSRDSNASDDTRVTTPTALETMLPWKRTDESEMISAPVKQSEFPPWCSNKEYLAYNSPSATFLGGVEPSRCSVIGLFRPEGEGSGLDSPSPQDETTVLLVEEDTALLGNQSADPKRTDEDYLGNSSKALYPTHLQLKNHSRKSLGALSPAFNIPCTNNRVGNVPGGEPVVVTVSEVDSEYEDESPSLSDSSTEGPQEKT
ncbi:hypothetical protein GE061_003413 [Apolygus lucorum]|uniref:Sodium/hydrogen exchanger n=1 Tax=Apolygus lucorum TaxID=248454 RepID=A0A8S9X3U8_APOLU|nr:hypothetical protein GE061_003413 [Apolygus lucorum]